MTNSRTKFGAVVAVAAGIAFLVGCSDDDPAPDDPAVANPASEFCVEQGGEVDIVDEAEGQVGYCVLPDGTRVDEWEYFRAENP